MARYMVACFTRVLVLVDDCVDEDDAIDIASTYVVHADDYEIDQDLSDASEEELEAARVLAEHVA